MQRRWQPEKPWDSHGPMVIIGDAAHAPSPSSGQGASMAAEDAVVLAKSLRDMPDIPRALDAYERQRRQRVERIVAQGARTSSAKTAGPQVATIASSIRASDVKAVPVTDIVGYIRFRSRLIRLNRELPRSTWKTDLLVNRMLGRLLVPRY